MVLEAIRGGFTRLFVFTGRDGPGLFWPYAIFVIGLFILATQIMTAPVTLDNWSKAMEIIQDPGKMPPPPPNPTLWDVSPLNPDHPLAPNYDLAWGGPMAVALFLGLVILLLAAATSRRLHDRDRSGLWGLLPLPFLVPIFWLASANAAAPGDLWRTNPALLIGGFAIGLLYMASMIYLVVLLGGKGTDGANRYGPDPRATEDAGSDKEMP